MRDLEWRVVLGFLRKILPMGGDGAAPDRDPQDRDPQGVVRPGQEAPDGFWRGMELGRNLQVDDGNQPGTPEGWGDTEEVMRMVEGSPGGWQDPGRDC